jgi:hypothetical protein
MGRFQEPVGSTGSLYPDCCSRSIRGNGLEPLPPHLGGWTFGQNVLSRQPITSDENVSLPFEDWEHHQRL